MAFSSKLGSLLRLNGQIPATSMFNSIRSMSSSTNKLFIGGLSFGTDDQSLKEAFSGFGDVTEGLSFGTDDQSLKEAFSGFGDVTEARIITDRDTGRSRGFGFVNFADDQAASSALSAMDGQELNGRNIRVSFANERPSGPRSFGGGDRGMGGGYGGGSGY